MEDCDLYLEFQIKNRNYTIDPECKYVSKQKLFEQKNMLISFY